MERNELLLSITRCPELALAQANANHSCAGVVGVQKGCSGGGYQVPEPWTGHIETAPIIFISSIPGIANNEHFPRKDWSDANTIDFFQRRFDEDAGYTVQMPSESQYSKVYDGDGALQTAGHHVQFWSNVRNIARVILGRRPIPGTDYMLSEMVHCKGPEKYAHKAVSLCSTKWMSPIMEHSGAVIVVLLGNLAQNAAAQLWGIDNSPSAQFDAPIAGRNRAVVILPHPNAREPRKIEHHVSQEELERLRALLPEK